MELRLPNIAWDENDSRPLWTSLYNFSTLRDKLLRHQGRWLATFEILIGDENDSPPLWRLRAECTPSTGIWVLSPDSGESEKEDGQSRHDHTPCRRPGVRRPRFADPRPNPYAQAW